ncbi:MAG: hypothetical protein ABR912_04135 [Terracidiphilus sp.]|jgi:hypothetical protein
METILRPLSLGEILDRTAQLYRNNFVLFAGISSVYAGFLLLMSLAQIGMTALLTSLQLTRQLPWVTMSYLILIFPLAMIVAGATMAANNRAVAWVNLGQPATIRGAYMSILPRLGRYLWLMTIATFIVYLPFAVIFVIYLVFLLAYAGSRGLLTHAAAGGDPQAAIVIAGSLLVFVVLCIPAFIYAIVMALRYSLAVPASVVEDLKARKALRRSVELSKGSLGRIFLLGLLIAIIQIGLALISEMFFVVAAFKAAQHHGVLPLWMQAAQQVIAFFTNSFIGPMYATGLTLFYYDQRIRKEGFDIEWMMQAAGMTVPALAAAPGAAPVAEPQPPPAPENPWSTHE